MRTCPGDATGFPRAATCRRGRPRRHAAARSNTTTAQALWLLLACLLVSTAGAQNPTAPTTPTAPTALSRLDDEQWQVREAATLDLLRDDRITTDLVLRWYAQATSLEARHRLADIALHHLLRELRERPPGAPGAPGAPEAEPLDPRQPQRRAAIQNLRPVNGSIGILHALVDAGDVRGLDTPAVRAIQTLPGFPGFSHLLPGDLIVGVDGRSFGEELQPELFTNLVQQRDPGQTMRLSVLRDGQPLEVVIPLAEASSLASMYLMSEQLAPKYAGLAQRLADRLAALHPTPTLPEPAAQEAGPEARRRSG